MQIQSFNQIINGMNGVPISLDIQIPIVDHNLPLIVFCHGFKGFKDWGAFNFIAKQFAIHKIAFLKFNFSHNGTNPYNLTEFADLDAFGNNNFSFELLDLQKVIDWVYSSFNEFTGYKFTSLCLMGHSRGGGISVLHASKDTRVQKLITWSAVSDFKKRLSVYPIAEWKKDGVYHILNSRTKQNMPLYYQFYKDFVEHEDEFNIVKAAKNINIPWMIVHAKDDPVVDLSEAEKLHTSNNNSELKLIPGGGHTFGATHPFIEDNISKYLLEAIDNSIKFILD